MNREDVGILLNPNNLKLQRHYFNQMVKLIGIQVLYRAPTEGKTYNGHGELDSFYDAPIKVGCIFVEHPNQYTMKKLGWVSELQEDNSLIQIPYDTPNIQRGALFIIPSGLDDGKGRVFRVLDMSTIQITPAYIVCKIGPMYENTFEQSQFQHKDNDFNLLADEEEDN